jgi:cell division transport system permease protein
MNFVILSRLIKSGLTSFLRNLGLSSAATLIMTITLLIISTIFILYTFTGIALDIAKDRVGGMTVYFNDTVTEKEITNVKAEVEAMPNVTQVTYVSKAEARQKFIELQKLKGRTAVLESLNEFSDAENPLPASLTIIAANLEDYNAISDNLRSERYTPYFKSISDNQKVISRLSNITNSIKNLGVFLVIVFVLVTIMVMFNTIRLAIYNRREEVEIMRLVGATNWYIRWPFFIESMIYAVLATVITSGLIILIILVFSGKIDAFFNVPGLSESLKRGLLWQVISMNLFLSLLLGVISSGIAMRRYLRV